MTQAVIVQQSPDVLPELERLQSMAGELRVKMGDLEIRRDQVARQRAEAKPADRPLLDKQWADVEHEHNVVMARLSFVTNKISNLEHARDMM